MNRAAIEELYDYDGWAWERLAESVQLLPQGTFERPAKGSGWPSLRNVLGHIAHGYHIWLSRVDAAGPPTFDSADADWAAIDDYYADVRTRFRAYLESLSDAELQADRDVPTWEGQVLRYTPAEVLSHILVHARAHHGDLYTLYHQLELDVDMPLLDYRYYVDSRR
ncbi:MAG: DinB family protein [Chloroflexota bacterium]